MLKHCAFLYCVGCSVIEQKVASLSEMTAQELQKREDSAQQIKRYVFVVRARDVMHNVLLFHAYYAILHCSGCSSMEQKVDRLSEMTAQGLHEVEDSAQQIKRCLLGWMCMILHMYAILSLAGSYHVFSSFCWVQFNGTESCSSY